MKNKVSEKIAAARFLLNVTEEVHEIWPIMYDSFKEFGNAFKIKMDIENEELAEFDLTLAVISLDLCALKNLFSEDQAIRIEKMVLNYMGKAGGEYAINEIHSYHKAINKNREQGVPDVVGAVYARLLRKWLGDRIKYFVDEKTGVINTVLMIFGCREITLLTGFWKNVKDNFILVREI